MAVGVSELKFKIKNLSIMLSLLILATWCLVTQPGIKDHIIPQYLYILISLIWPVKVYCVQCAVYCACVLFKCAARTVHSVNFTV